jgi:hypothetical protein
MTTSLTHAVENGYRENQLSHFKISQEPCHRKHSMGIVLTARKIDKYRI